MLTIFAFVLSFVASTLAYLITFPTADSGWTDSGSQLINYTRVAEDKDFSVVIDNQNKTGFQLTQLVALVHVDPKSMDGSITVNAPSGGFQPGPDYRVNFVRPDNVHAIYAQSAYFNIISASNSTSTSGSMIVVAPTPTSRTGDSPTGTSDSSASDSANILPTSSSAATLSYTIQTSLLGLFSLLGFALA